MDPIREAWIRGLPKAELHVHIEGTLEPEMMFGLAKRNDVGLPFSSVDEVRGAYEFTDLQSFLDLYYQGAAVLQREDDFYDLMVAYLTKAARDGVRRAEIFFDPQTHLEHGVRFPVFMEGFLRAIDECAVGLGISTGLILCYLRHLSVESAAAAWEEAAQYLSQIVAIGLDSSEMGNPPEPFEKVYALARGAGLRTVAHAGEEGPPSYILGAIDTLGVERIDHGVRSEEDDEVVSTIVESRIPLTMCPLSNVKLNVFDDLSDHNLKRLMDRGVRVTINSDDPAYFGGYIGDNYVAVTEALGLTNDEVFRIARTSLEATFLADAAKDLLLSELNQHVGGPA